MTRSRLRSSNQSLPVRLALGLYELCASVQLAVVLISATAYPLLHRNPGHYRPVD